MSKKNIPYIIRIPIIPQYNDSQKDINDFISFIEKLKNQPERIDILPYNPLCVEKYNSLDRDFLLKDIKAPPKEKINYIVERFKAFGFKVNIGGN